MCERKLEADEWVNEFLFLASQTASKAWSSFHLQLRDSTYTKSISQTFQLQEQLLPRLWTKTSSHQLLFSKKMTNANFHQTPQLFLDPVMIYWGKQKVIWWERWEECCGRSDMGNGVRPGLNVLLNELRHFWLKAACWDSPLSTYANQLKQLSHTSIYFCSDAHIHTHTHTHIQQHVGGQTSLHAKSQSISERLSFHNTEQNRQRTHKLSSAELLWELCSCVNTKS